tara:strand:+ start:16595 stop:17500 length:906 start_codon:yes stop_codon:yes gene_type:complete
LFFSLTLLLFWLLTLWAETNEVKKNDYLHAIVAKHQRADSLEGTRIILTGGSNMAFGIDSKRIQDSLKLPVVNLALHAGLGLEFVCNEVMEVWRPGDIVLIAPEYYQSIEGQYGLQQLASSFYPEASSYFQGSLKQFILNKIDRTRTDLRFMFYPERHAPNPVYSSDAFNKFGDVAAHLSRDRRSQLDGGSTYESVYWDGISLLQNLIDRAKAENVCVFLTYPAYAETEYDKNKRAITRLQQDLTSNLGETILGTPEDHVFPDTQLYDFVYHLHTEARQQRTLTLIQLLQQALKKQPHCYQ